METPLVKQRANKVFPIFALLVFAAVLLVYAAAVGIAGGSLLGLVAYPAAMGLFVLLPGLFLCDVLLPGFSGAGRWVVAFAMGSVLPVLCFELLGRFAPVWLCGVPGALLGLWGLWRRRKTLRLPRLSRVGTGGWWLLVLFSAAVFFFVFTGVFAMAKPSAAGNLIYHQDILFSIGNSAAVRFGAPLHDIRSAGGLLHYHYFSEVLCGLVAIFSGQSAWDASSYYNFLPYAAGLAAALYTLGRRFGAGPWAALLAPAGALLAHHLWTDTYYYILMDMNGVLQAFFYLAAVVVVLLQAESEGFKNRRALAAFGLAFAALVWTKSTMGALLLCGLLAAFAVHWLLHKKPAWWLLWAAAIGAAITAVLYLYIFSQVDVSLALRPSAAQTQDVLRKFAWLMLPACLLWLLSLVFTLKDFKKLTPTGLMMNALVPGGLLASILFYHWAASQEYFLLAALFAVWLCVARAAKNLCSTRMLAGVSTAILAVGIATGLYTNANVLRQGVQISLRCLQLRPQYGHEDPTASRQDAEAAQWLKTHMATGQVFATNRNNASLAVPEGVFHYYTAASEQQAYIEGWRYAMDYSSGYDTVRHQLEVVSDGIFAQPSYKDAAALAAQNNIDYLLVYLPAGGHAFEGGEPVFQNESVLIYAVE